MRNWHPGKLIILWSWGGLAAGFALTYFLSQPVAVSPLAHLFSLGLAMIILVALSVMTWCWLSGREAKRENE